jgi:hypothetical protein
MEDCVAGIDWGSIADWVSGIGSLCASAVALYVAHISQRVKLRGYCGHRLIVIPGQPQLSVFSVSVTNVSQRPTVITNIGITFGLWNWKRHGIITFTQDDIGPGIPKQLLDGETENWNIRLGQDNKWLTDLVEQFSVTRFSVLTWRIQIHTSNGGITTLRPEKNIRDMMLACMASKKAKLCSQ